jgi:Flp pilus assembly protein TadG
MNARSVQYHRGFISAWVSVSLATLLAFVGLTVDVGHAYTVGVELQNAADSAALAAVSQLSTSFSAAQTAAINAAANNKAAGASVQLANSDVVEGNYNTTTGTPYNAIKVSARLASGSPGGPLNLTFGKLVGISTCNVTRTAVAFAGSGGTTSAGFIALDPSGSGALTISGAASLVVGGTGGVIYVDSSNAAKAASITASGSLTATNLDIVGELYTSGNPTINATVNTGVAPLADPLSTLAAPTKTADLGSINLDHANTQTVGTGSQTAVYYYSGGIQVAGSATLTLNAGIYILGPPGLSISHGGTLNATNCMFYLTGSGSSYGTVSFAGNAAVNITPPSSGTYAGMAIFQDRTTPASNAMTVANGTTENITGTIYLPSSQIAYSGGTNSLGNQIIANDIAVTNGAALTVAYDGRNPVTTGTATENLGQ